MKRIIILITLLFVLLFMAMIANAEQIEIEFWTINLSPRFDNYFNEMMDKYEDNNPGVKIIWEDVSFSAIKQKLLYNINEGNPPDVVNLSTELARPLIEERLLLPVGAEYKDDYYEGLWEAGVLADKCYAFPWYVSTQILIYNKDIFLVSGLDPAKPPKTLKELREYGKIIKDKTGIYGFMPQIRLHHEFLKAGIPLFKENGGRKPGFVCDKAEEIIEWYCNLKKQGIIPEDTVSEGFNLALSRYIDGELGILLTGPQFLGRIKERDSYIYEVTGVAPLPLREEKVVSAGVMNLVIPASSDYPEKAKDFAHFMSDDYAQLLFAQEANVLPSAKINREEDNFTGDHELLARARQISLKQLERAVDMTLTIPDADLLIRVIDEEFARAFSDKITPAVALENMEEKWKQILTNK